MLSKFKEHGRKGSWRIYIELKLNEQEKELLGDEQEEKEEKSPNKRTPER